jgi:hypothetical protein
MSKKYWRFYDDFITERYINGYQNGYKQYYKERTPMSPFTRILIHMLVVGVVMAVAFYVIMEFISDGNFTWIL